MEKHWTSVTKAIKSETFTKSDLKTGMLVKTRNGELKVCIKDYLGRGDDLFIGTHWSDIKTGYNDDLTANWEGSRDWDIMEVWEPNYNVALTAIIAEPSKLSQKATCIMQRVEVVELTLKDVAEKFGLRVEQVRIKD